MKQFYHRTNKENIKKILDEGLKTGAELGIQTYYFSEKAPFDGNYVYLLKNLEVLGEGEPHQATLIVELPDNHPVERDYDLVNILQNMFRNPNPFMILGILEKIEQLGIQHINGTYDFSSREKIIKQLKEIPGEKWDAALGYYRSPEQIPNEWPYKIKLLESVQTEYNKLYEQSRLKFINKNSK